MWAILSRAKPLYAALFRRAPASALASTSLLGSSRVPRGYEPPYGVFPRALIGPQPGRDVGFAMSSARDSRIPWLPAAAVVAAWAAPLVGPIRLREEP